MEERLVYICRAYANGDIDRRGFLHGLAVVTGSIAAALSLERSIAANGAAAATSLMTDGGNGAAASDAADHGPSQHNGHTGTNKPDAGTQRPRVSQRDWLDLSRQLASGKRYTFEAMKSIEKEAQAIGQLGKFASTFKRGGVIIDAIRAVDSFGETYRRQEDILSAAAAAGARVIPAPVKWAADFSRKALEAQVQMQLERGRKTEDVIIGFWGP